MRFSEAWLRELVNPPLSTEQLVAQLTMAGLEVEAVEPVAGTFSGVVVGEVLAVAPHPEADRLRVCRVSAGFVEPLTIVCGAPNVETGMKAPLALEGAVLPGGMTISRSKLRGVESSGMLCSARELGFDDGQPGLLALPGDAPTGAQVRDYLQLDDVSLELNLTPNRADCLSVEGVAREVALLNGIQWEQGLAAVSAVSMADTFPVVVEASDACPRYLGRLVRNVERSAGTPLWMQERLRRSGLRSLGPLVDVTNYVLLELGQPLHAFDASKLRGSVHVRYGNDGEKLTLLNDQEIVLQKDVLVIADEERPLALAGVMGGADSAVDDGTTDLFLECAFFTPAAIMGKARRYGLNTDSSHRFERGVDPQLQRRAMERATELLLDIVGGVAGPIVEVLSENHLPRRDPIVLLRERVASLLGVSVTDEHINRLLSGLEMKLEPWHEGWDPAITPVLESRQVGWKVTPPSFRFDISIEADLIEEIGRIYGYNNIPLRNPAARMELQPVSEGLLDVERVKDLLVDRGYQEAITYSFVEPKALSRLEPDVEALALQNPISSDMAVMRTGLWCGLIDAALKNLNRQQNRIRLFETGFRFSRRNGEIIQEKSLAGLALGPVWEEQWGEKARDVDFFDVKADLEALLHLAGHEGSVKFVAGSHPALHPGQTAEIVLNGLHMGWLGQLHPKLENEFGFEDRVFLFEFDQSRLLSREITVFAPLSKYPQVRRDLALLVEEKDTAESLIACVKRQSPLIRRVLVFDVYQGPGIDQGKKSVALGIVLQDDTETLTDARVDDVIGEVIARLAQEFNAKLRD